MSEEGFLRRWARRKSELRSELQTEVREGRAPVPDTALGTPRDVAAPILASDAAAALSVPDLAQAAATPQATPPTGRPLPTLDDVAALDANADFSTFVARGVDQAVRRGALKKLFADPHFNVMDGLDVYIDDYTKPSPMSEAMLASLEHAKSVFMKMIEDDPPPPPPPPPEQETQ
jgi:hypothetical protein